MNKLQIMHSYLMSNGFPYHSVSVVNKPQDICFHVIFMKSERERVTDEIKEEMEINGFDFSYV